MSDFVVLDEITVEDEDECRRKKRKLKYFHCCQYCVQKFESPANLKDHIFKNHKIRCDFCDRVLESLSKYVRHFESKHLKVERSCKCCGERTFYCSQRYVEHLVGEVHQWNLDTRDIQCSICRHKGITSLERYNIHIMEEHSKEKLRKCKVCSLKFKSVSEFVKHTVLTHRVSTHRKRASK